MFHRLLVFSRMIYRILQDGWKRRSTKKRSFIFREKSISNEVKTPSSSHLVPSDVSSSIKSVKILSSFSNDHFHSFRKEIEIMLQSIYPIRNISAKQSDKMMLHLTIYLLERINSKQAFAKK